MTASQSVSVIIEPFQSDLSPDQAEFRATIEYLDSEKVPQIVNLRALEPLHIINAINDTLRNNQIDVRRIPADTLPPLPPAKEEEEAKAEEPAAEAVPANA